MWTDVREKLPPTNTAVLACYLDIFIGSIIEKCGMAYHDKQEGWFSEGNHKLTGVIHWRFPELPEDPRFAGLTDRQFAQRYSVNAAGTVVTKVLLRKKRQPKPDYQPTTAEAIVGLEAKFKGIDHNLSFAAKVRALNENHP